MNIQARRATLNKKLGLLQFLYNSPPQTLYTDPRRSIPTLDIPDQFKYPLTHLRPFIPIPTHSHPSQPIHTHPRPSIPTKVFSTHLRPSTHLSPLHQPQALHSQPKPFTPISGPSHPYQALHTHPWAPTVLLGPLHPP